MINLWYYLFVQRKVGPRALDMRFLVDTSQDTSPYEQISQNQPSLSFNIFSLNAMTLFI